MPSQIIQKKAQVTEGNDVWLSGRILTADNTALVQGDTASGANMAVRVFDKAQGGKGRDPNTSIFTKTDIDETTTIFNTYQTDGYWDGLDSTGYNFLYQLIYDTAGTTGPYLRANHTYLVQFELETSSFGTIRWSYVLDVLPSDPS